MDSAAQQEVICGTTVTEVTVDSCSKVKTYLQKSGDNDSDPEE
jgi:hypothetical protein